MKKKLLFIIGVALFLGSTSYSQNAEFDWAVAAGGTAAEQTYSMSIDDSGNVLTIGTFGGTVDFDPGAGVSNLTSSGSTDFYIQKLDASGNLVWAKRTGGTSNDFGYAISTDASGNVYTTGIFQQTVDFDPGVGTFNLSAYGNTYDIFIQKLDVNGNFLWAKKMGYSGYDVGQAIATDAMGNVYITGRFQTTVDFDPGAGTFNLSVVGSNDIFIQKLNTNGDFVWAKQMGGTAQEQGRSITLDGSGNIFTTGSFSGTVDFDPGAGVSNLTTPLTGSDIFIQKLDVNGDFVWVKNVGGSNNSISNGIKSDSSGDTYITGYFTGTTDFDPGANTVNLVSNGSRDAFILKLDANGDYLWVKQTGGTGQDEGWSVTTDSFDDVYTTGYFRNTTDFDPGTGTFNLIANGSSSSIYIQKLDSNGDFLWAKGMGGTSNDVGKAIAVDNNNNVYSTGFFVNTVDFDPGANVANLTSAGSWDAYVQKLTQPCFETVDTQIKCDSFTWIDGVTYTASNSNATQTLTSSLGCDSIVTLDLTINASTSSTDVVSACGTYTWIDGNTYTASNSAATFTLVNSEGCDSVITLNLTMNFATTGTDLVTACDSYSWIDGNTYTASNNSATYTLVNSQGCDSIVTLNLTINNSTTGTDVVTACDSYDWLDGNTYTSSNNSATITLTNTQGCDSIVTLNLTINQSDSETDVIASCDPYTWLDGNTYSVSNNTATLTLTNSSGCDSILMLDLTITPLDLSITENDNILTANEANGVYQWVDCDNSNQAIVGETSQSFEPTVNGSYACIIDNGACSDTSSCVDIVTIGIDQLEVIQVSIAPNPASSKLTVISDSPIKEIVISILTGQHVLTTNNSTIDLYYFKKGVYLITVFTERGNVTKRIIKE